MSETFYTSGPGRSTSASFSFHTHTLISQQKSLKALKMARKTSDKEVVGLINRKVRFDLTGLSRASPWGPLAPGNERTERDDFIKSGLLGLIGGWPGCRSYGGPRHEVSAAMAASGERFLIADLKWSGSRFKEGSAAIRLPAKIRFIAL